ncbi:VIT1/CCC1 transporter family protein [Candidatus Woesearchaeota archaeon]|nr:VIT1/CCC1 transporter family protein [Candidatus Woesearchaeota archaeon]
MGKFKDFWKVLAEHEIVRRYVIINSFDGALTVLGIIFAEFFSNITDPKLIILPGLGAAVAMCVSGIWGAYSAERAEVRSSIRSMEAHLLHNLSGTEFTRKREKMAWMIGLVDGLSPLIAAIVIILPFFFLPSVLSMTAAYYAAFTLVAIILFLLGSFAGRIAKENVIKQGSVMLLAGVVIGAVFMLLTYLGVL